VIGRALLVWLLLAVLAIANGTLRTLVLAPRIGEHTGRFVSTLLLSVFIAVAAWLTIPWIEPATERDAWLVGGIWLVLTLAFEFGVGHWVFRNSWKKLLDEYDLSKGRIWTLVLATTLLAPVVAFRLGGR
jgi:uncharacterized membrane protein